MTRTVRFAYPEPPFGRLGSDDLAKRFDDARHAMLALDLCIPLLAIPEVIVRAHESLGDPTLNRTGFGINRADGTPYLRTTVNEVMNQAQEGLRFLLGGDLFRLPPMLLSVWLDNEIKRTNLKPKRHLVPELELIRHLRNGSAHGNKWYFERGQPKHPASFKSFVVTPTLHGKEVFFSSVGPAEFLELLEHIAAYLRAGKGVD